MAFEQFLRKLPQKTVHQETTAFGEPPGGGENPAQSKASEMVSEAMAATEKAKPVRSGPKVGRNDPCPCGSGKKYKHCCGKSV